MTEAPLSSARLSGFLARAPQWLQNSIAVTAAFAAYFCMYAFRKPFSAGTFDGELLGFSTKTVFVISQIIGYALSKYLGARLLPAMHAEMRALWLVRLVSLAWLALLGFALSPDILAAICLFINGLCLGMIWGLVVGHLEGRRSSELLLAGLSCSFILASGVVKDVGRAFMRAGMDERWMPFSVGALFFIPLVAASWILHHIPPPTRQDEALRTRRVPMTAGAQLSFLRKLAVPMLLLLASYFFLTAFRDYRDNFGVELFAELGYREEPALFSQTELPVALCTLLVLGLLSLVRDNRRAVTLVFVAMGSGLLLVWGAGLALRAGAISGLSWMILIGIGSYLAYVPFGSVLFDRIIAHTRIQGTAIFGIYLADAVGYTGSVLLQLFSDVVTPSSERLHFFLRFADVMTAVAVLCLGLCATLLFRIQPPSLLPTRD